MSYGLQSVTVSLEGTMALDDVTITVAPGTVVAVVGGDGAGKSTLARTLVGRTQVQAGTVRAPHNDLIGYLPASAGSWLELSVSENLDFVGEVFGMRRGARDQRRDDLIRTADLDDARDRLSGQLSGGMRRKLGFSLAMMHEPPLLVLDEPSTGVDPVSRVDLWRLISRTAAAGAAVLMTTTYLDEAERAEHLIVLDVGRVVIQGPPDDVLAGFAGVITESVRPVRSQWAWRRGRVFHELWPEGPPPAPADGTTRIDPDLEDIVIAMSLQHRAAT